MNDGVAGVAGREQHFQARPSALRFIGKLAAVNASGHYHVSEQQIDRMFRQALQRGGPARGFNDE